MTLLEDLETAALELVNCEATSDANADEQLAIAARLRAHATRLRDEMAFLLSEMQRGSEYAAAALMVLERINGGSSPPITPGSPGAIHPDAPTGYGPYITPASPPTTPTCANWCGSHNSNASHDCWSTQPDGFCYCTTECRDARKPPPPEDPMTSHRQLARARRLVEMWAADNRIDDLAVEWAWSDDTIASASECFRVAASLALDGMPARGPYTSPPCTPVVR